MAILHSSHHKRLVTHFLTFSSSVPHPSVILPPPFPPVISWSPLMGNVYCLEPSHGEQPSHSHPVKRRRPQKKNAYATIPAPIPAPSQSPGLYLCINMAILLPSCAKGVARNKKKCVQKHARILVGHGGSYRMRALSS